MLPYSPSWVTVALAEMRPDRFFGDSYDLVKRFLLSTLGELEPRGWNVHPMFTGKVSEELKDAFEHLVGAPLIFREKVIAKNRASVLDVARSAGHLLLDPDTGVCMEELPESRSRYHVYRDELVSLVRARPRSLTVVFDQSVVRFKGAAPKEEQLTTKLQHFRATGLGAFAYKSHACFLFLAKDSALLARAHSLLRKAGVPVSQDRKPGLTELLRPLPGQKR